MGEWTQVAPELNGQSRIECLAVYNGKLYGGTMSGGRLFEWDDDDEWVQVAPEHLTRSTISALIVYDNGDGDALYGASNGYLFRWNDVDAWVDVSGYPGDYPTSLVEYNGKLYVGTNPDGSLFEWNDVDTLTQVAGKLGVQTSIRSLCVYNGKLYGGTSPDGLLYEWNDVDAWVKVADQLVAELSITELVVFDDGGGDALYGCTWNAGTLQKWNDVDAWDIVAPYFSGESSIFGMAIFNGAIYGGTSTHGRLYKWNGTDAWEQICAQLNGQIEIHELIEYNGKLYGGTGSGGRLFEFTPPGVELNDSLSLADEMSAGTSFADTISLTDSIISASSKTLIDTITLTDLVVTIANRLVADGISLDDALLSAISVALADSLGLTDALLAGPQTEFNDTISLNDTLPIAASVALSDNISLFDDINESSNKLLYDTITLSDQIAPIFANVLMDVISVHDYLTGIASHVLADNITIRDLLEGELGCGFVVPGEWDDSPMTIKGGKPEFLGWEKDLSCEPSPVGAITRTSDFTIITNTTVLDYNVWDLSDVEAGHIALATYGDVEWMGVVKTIGVNTVTLNKAGWQQYARVMGTTAANIPPDGSYVTIHRIVRVKRVMLQAHKDNTEDIFIGCGDDLVDANSGHPISAEQGYENSGLTIEAPMDRWLNLTQIWAVSGSDQKLTVIPGGITSIGGAAAGPSVPEGDTISLNDTLNGTLYIGPLDGTLSLSDTIRVRDSFNSDAPTAYSDSFDDDIDLHDMIFGSLTVAAGDGAAEAADSISLNDNLSSLFIKGWTRIHRVFNYDGISVTDNVAIGYGNVAVTSVSDGISLTDNLGVETGDLAVELNDYISLDEELEGLVTDLDLSDRIYIDEDLDGELTITGEDEELERWDTINVIDSLNASILGGFPTECPIQNDAVKVGNYLYCTALSPAFGSGIMVWNVADPSSPMKQNYLRINTPPLRPWLTKEIGKIIEDPGGRDYLFITTKFPNDGISSIDINAPGSPVLADTISHGPWPTSTNKHTDLCGYGNRIYVAVINDGLRMYNTDNPGAMTRIETPFDVTYGIYDECAGGDPGNWHHPYDIVDGDYVHGYLLNGADRIACNSQYIIVADGGRLFWLNRADVPSVNDITPGIKTPSHTGYIGSFAMVGNIAHLHYTECSPSTDYTFQVIGKGASEYPSAHGTLSLPNFADWPTYYKAEVSGLYTYICNGYGVDVMNISTGSEGYVYTDVARSFHISGNYLYYLHYVSEDHHLDIYNISVPLAPVLVGTSTW